MRPAAHALAQFLLPLLFALLAYPPEAYMQPTPRRFIDLSHAIEDGMETFPGLPAPRIEDHIGYVQSRAHYAPGTEFQIGRISMVANTGTYLDTPSHRFDGGTDLAGLELSSVADLPAVALHVPERGQRAITAADFEGLDVAGKAVLVHTGWARHWRTERYFQGHPYLTEDAARHLRDQGAVLVGIDSLNIDDMEDRRRPVHTLLLAAGIPIVEHMRGLEQLPSSGFRFSAVPVKVQGMGTFPVRAYAVL
jgi:arylformamidase